MLITIDQKALAWFKKEFEFSEQSTIRMFPQYAGFGQKNKEYSLGFSLEAPTNAEYKQEMEGITFYFEGNDAWFFNETETFLTTNDAEELDISFKELIIN